MKMYILAQLVSCIALTDAFMAIPSRLRNAGSVLSGGSSSTGAGVEQKKNLLESRYRLQNKLGSSFDCLPSSQLFVNIQRDCSELANHEDVLALPGPTVPIPEAYIVNTMKNPYLLMSGIF